jgi:hypothetical protein
MPKGMTTLNVFAYFWHKNLTGKLLICGMFGQNQIDCESLHATPIGQFAVHNFLHRPQIDKSFFHFLMAGALCALAIKQWKKIGP